MLLPAIRPAFLLVAALFALAADAAAQGPRSQLIAPPDLWIRADVERDWGQPLLLTTCEVAVDIAEAVETLPVEADGSYTVVRTFTAPCACDRRHLVERQFIHILPATPLPQAAAGSGCAPQFTAAPEAQAVVFGAPAATVVEAVCADGASVRAVETEHVLWNDACGLGARWVVWEAVGPCGDAVRHAFVRETVAAPVSVEVDVPAAVEVPVGDFDADDWGVGPLATAEVAWEGTRAVELYRTAAGSSGSFAVVAIGCSAVQSVGTQNIAAVGNHEPWIRYRPEAEVACGAPRSEWPEVRGMDRLVGGFGDQPPYIELPVAEEVDTLEGPCAGTFRIERRFRVEDADGAVAEATQWVTVVDDAAPEFYASPETVVVSGADWPPVGATAAARDACSGEVTLAWSDSTDCSTGRVIRITTATDGCGNAATLRQVLVPEASAPPTVLAVGCSDPNALNFTGDACFETQHCLYAGDASCMGDLDGNGHISTGDLLALLGIFGTWCSAAP